MKLPTVIHVHGEKIRKLWEAYDQAIYGVDGGYVLVPDQEPCRWKEAIVFTGWDDAYYCLMAEPWPDDLGGKSEPD